MAQHSAQKFRPLAACFRWLRGHPKTLVCLFVLAGLCVLLFPETGTRTNVRATEAVRVGHLRRELPVTGIIKPEEGAEVKTGSRFTGVIKTLHVKLGDAVKKNQIIAELDAREQEAECRKLEASIRKFRAELRLAEETYPLQIKETEALVASAKAEEGYTRTKHQRMTALGRISGISKDDEDNSRRAADMASANSRLQQAVKQRIEAEYSLRTVYLREAIAEAEADLMSAGIRRSYATIVSPMDGVISEITAQEGETLVAGLQVAYLVTVLDTRRLELQIFVDENDIGQVSPGSKVSFTVEAFRDRVFAGVVDLIHPGPEVRNNIVYYRALVRLEPEVALQLRPEMTARCNVMVAEKDEALLVPNESFKWLGDKRVVFVVEDGTVTPVAVRTGIEGLTHTEVLDALRSGQQVATKLDLPSPLPEEWLQ
jgi:multidrug efflux pump subunit AcrA (membrane-fusion protein)